LIQKRQYFFSLLGLHFPVQFLMTEQENSNRLWIYNDRIVDVDTVQSMISCRASEVVPLINGIHARVLDKTSIGHLRFQDICTQPNAYEVLLGNASLCMNGWINLAIRYISDPAIGDSGIYIYIYIYIIFILLYFIIFYFVLS
jgi:hypothetical protein